MRLRNLEKYRVEGAGDRMLLSFPRPRSPSGKVRERCPQSTCQPGVFLLGAAPEAVEVKQEMAGLMRRVPGTQGVTCPYCGHDGPDEDFRACEDVEHAKRLIGHAVKKDISDMLAGVVRSSNRRQRPGGFVSVRMEHKPARTPEPHAYREDLLRNISCHVCEREYGVFALALFCPDCGSPNVSTHFRREIELIERQVALSQRTADDDEELAYRLLANAHEDVVTALETTLKAIYRHIVTRAGNAAEGANVGNAFQNLDRARDLFSRVGIDLFAETDASTVDELRRHIQKRHAIGHNLGLADEKYVRSDAQTEIGRNVPIVAGEVTMFASACETLVRTLEAHLTETSGDET